jgi:hypothetical protein
MPPAVKRRIQRIDQSPMNEQIWVIQLEGCGHDVYVTQKKRPSRERTWTDKATGERMCGPKLMACPKCEKRSR